MNQVASVDRHELAESPAPSEAVTIMSVIDRAARDPHVDIDKMERLMQMHERITTRQAESEFNSSLASMQSRMPTIAQTGFNDHTKKSYALFSDINEVVRPIMQEYGFAVTFKVENPDVSHIAITGILVHRGGHRESTTITMPADMGKGRNDVQALGSSISYGRRYVLCSLLNITTADMKDDDAQTAVKVQTITGPQVEMINRAWAGCGDKVKALFSADYPNVALIHSADFNAILNSLESAANKYQLKVAASSAKEEQA
jgi:hypothetical protein